MKLHFLASIILSVSPLRLSAAECVERLGEETRLLYLFECISEMNAEIEQLKFRMTPQATSVSVPSGAVLPFDRSEGCPSGWLPFYQADGRAIIGATQFRNTTSLKVTGVERFFRETGGQETVALTIENMARHQHSSPTVADRSVRNFGFAEDVPAAMGGTSWNQGHVAGTTSIVGEGLPHENMPPFIALHFCKKI